VQSDGKVDSVSLVGVLAKLLPNAIQHTWLHGLAGAEPAVSGSSATCDDHCDASSDCKLAFLFWLKQITFNT
jgi:hypothetical protein